MKVRLNVTLPFRLQTFGSGTDQILLGVKRSWQFKLRVSFTCCVNIASDGCSRNVTFCCSRLTWLNPKSTESLHRLFMRRLYLVDVPKGEVKNKFKNYCGSRQRQLLKFLMLLSHHLLRPKWIHYLVSNNFSH